MSEMNWKNIDEGKCPFCATKMLDGTSQAEGYRCPKCLSEYSLIAYGPTDISWTRTKKPRLTKDFLCRKFPSGATRSAEKGKPDYEGFLSPVVIKEYGRYMMKHQTQEDGATRESDNWQKGIPKTSYAKSLYRHFLDLWLYHRGHKIKDDITDVCCAIMFNVMGYLHTHLTEDPPIHLDDDFLALLEASDE